MVVIPIVMVVIPIVMMMIRIVMVVIPIVMMMIRTTKQPVEDCLARIIAYLPTAPILVTHHVSLSDAVVAPKRVQRQGGRAGRKGDTAGGCK